MTRRSLYNPFTIILDPLWLYSPAMIAEVSAAFGFLDAIGKKRANARQAFSRYSVNGKLPKRADRQERIGRYASRLWYGWRWQLLDSLQEGREFQEILQNRFWGSWAKNQKHWSLEQAMATRYDLSPDRRAIERVRLILWALRNGLDPSGSYTPKTWCEPFPTSMTLELLPLSTLKPAHLYTITEIAQLCYPEQKQRQVIATLYSYVRKHQGSMAGDQRDEHNIPRWLGSSWQALAEGNIGSSTQSSWKYASLLLQLPNDQLFTPTSIVMWAKNRGLINGDSAEEQRLHMMRIRTSLYRLVKRYQLSLSGELGSTWKEIISL